MSDSDAIITGAAADSQVPLGLALLKATQESGGIDALPVPDRTDRARSVDFD
ncbi:hypothetical protein [Microlunatus sp. GCM10028923]|uniref:hypothetical protein n=1 Tax=Microlunatus sp. GCM10028923 TaxID=3273400 RepID=UPI0036244BEE